MPVAEATTPSPTLTASLRSCNRCAPIAPMRVASSRHAVATAPPAITAQREPQVPVEYGVSAVSPCTTMIFSSGRPRTSCATWASVVSSPWPWLWMPTRSSSPPSGVMRATACSKPGTIGMPQPA